MGKMHIVNSFTLENKIKLVHVYVPNFPVAVTSFWSKVGSRDDPKGKEGMAHFFEHLLMTRTARFPDRQRRLVEVEKRGFLFNAFTSLETSHYFYVHSNETLSEAVRLLVDGCTSSIFGSKDIDEERQIIVDEERRNRNDPESYIWRLANSGLWPKSQLGSNFYGNVDSLGKIASADLEEFYSEYYQPWNSTFVFINSIKNIDEQTSKVGKLNKVGGLQKSHSDKFGKKIDIVFDQRELNYLLISMSFITSTGKNYRDCLVLELIKNYLAGGWTSRLNSRLRVESKLTYWVDGRSDKLSDTGILRFTASVNNEKVSDILKIFEEEIISLKTKNIENDILDQHKNKFSAELMRNCLNTNFLNWWYGADLTAFDRKPLSIEDYIKDMEKIDGDEIRLVADKYLNSENFSLAIIGKEQIVDKIPTFQ